MSCSPSWKGSDYADISRPRSLSRSTQKKTRHNPEVGIIAGCMSGVDLYTLQALMRHRSSLMTQRYAHLSAAHQRDAIRRLDGWHERRNPIAERRS
jgi:hypothetical protein